jgi:homoserine dehydrogenase
MGDELKTVKIGLLGFGVVGQGVWKNIEQNRSALETRLGVELNINKIVVRNLNRERIISVPETILTTNANEVLEDDSIDIICELIGGTNEALTYTEEALKRGKIVVSANKALICDHGESLFELARQHGGHYFYEASVAGGIPIIKTICEALIANRFSLIFGILNGTSNYILTRMEREGLSFEETLGDARKLGYVEADESLDLDGIDAAHKLVILNYLAHGIWVNLKDIICEGIRSISKEDIEIARQLGYKIKLIGVIARDFSHNSVSVRLHPALIAKTETLAEVNEVYNGVSVTGDVVGTTVLIGRGAGQDATSSSVISDIADAVSLLKGEASTGRHTSVDPKASPDEITLELSPPDRLEGRYYFRFHVKDEEGVLAEISNIFAKHHISFATVNQKELSDNSALIMVTTHKSSEVSVLAACEAVKQLGSFMADPVYLRIFNPEDYSA